MKNQAKQTISWIIAFITCPCHLILIGALFAGTTVGSVLNAYFIPLAIFLSVIFVIAIINAVRVSKK